MEEHIDLEDNAVLARNSEGLKKIFCTDDLFADAAPAEDEESPPFHPANPLPLDL